jgi:hypothetical protein
MALCTACGGSTFELFPDPPRNTAPVANAGSAQSVVVGAVVTLDGSASSDANGNTLTYSWAFTSKPSVSTATLSSATTVKPTFTADTAGSYVLSLTVNDGNANSAPATVTITASTGNVPPVANAGKAQSVVINTLVTLDGSASSDANSDLLTYSWTFTKPTGSAATLSSTTAVNPTFTADIVGAYILSLTVNDGKVNSTTPATVTVTAFNTPPTANAGLDRIVIEGTPVQLDGSGSSGAVQSYNWSRQSPACGSLSSATIVNPILTGSSVGTCVIALQVSNTIGSTTDTVSITITPSNTGSLTVTW